MMSGCLLHINIEIESECFLYENYAAISHFMLVLIMPIDCFDVITTNKTIHFYVWRVSWLELRMTGHPLCERTIFYHYSMVNFL